MMDWSTIIVAIISFLGTAVGAFSGMKLMSYRIEQLEKRVEEHNGYARRLPVLEEKVENIDRRVEALEHGH